MNVSLVVPSRNNLKYVKFAYESIREYMPAETEVILLDDASTDGTWDWMKSVKSDKTQIYRNEGPNRVGHTVLYDQGAKMATKEVFGIFHADMVASLSYIPNMVKHLKRGTVVSATRIEPPLHPPGPEKIVENFGMEPETFQTDYFLKFVNRQEKLNKNKTTSGIFAPWIMYVEDFFAIGGHDKRLFAPMELEDSLHENRILTIIENNNIQLIRFSELFEKYKTLKEIREDGKEIIDFHKNKINIKTSTAKIDGKIGCSFINKLIRKPNTKKLLKIITTWGETVCTEDHSLIDKNLTPTIPKNISIDTIWKPNGFEDWTRRFYYKELNLNNYIKNFIPDSYSNYTDYTLPIIKNINHKGTNQKLKDICEFLGFFVAEGSTPVDSYIKFDNNDLDLLNYFKEKSTSLFGDIHFQLKTNKKENCKDVYSYTKGSIKLSKFLDNILGNGSKNKKVPNFIFNLPKLYQQSFLYGYLSGDGYLGSYIQKNSNITYIKADKRFIFKRKIFEILDCKFTTKSDRLASGIIFLLRNNYPNLSINLNFDKTKEVYNIITNKSKQDKILKIENFNEKCEYVYDIEMNNYGEHTFIDSLGCFGVHNSDLFNRFLLKGYKMIQSRDAFVYHMTCRGSRFKDGINIIQEIPVGEGKVWKRSQDSDEYTTLRQIKFREWWRKWHMNVLHDTMMMPKVCKRYDVGFVIHNIEHNQYQLLSLLEPWCDTLYSNTPVWAKEQYSTKEEQKSNFNIGKKLRSLTPIGGFVNDVLVEFRAEEFRQEHYQFIENLMFIIEDSATEIGEFEYDIFKFTIKSMESYEKNLIHADDPWLLDKLKQTF